jgi:hypothetical protein
MNLVNGKIVRKAGGLAFSGKAGEFFLPSTLGKAIWKSRVAINEDVSLGVGLKDTSLTDKPEPGSIQFQGEIVALEMEESNTLVTASVGDERIRLIAGAGSHLHIGQIISIAFSLSGIFLVRNLTGELFKGLST